MRTDFERKVQWCMGPAVYVSEMNTKRAEGLAPFDPGIRFSTVAVVILGPETMATSTRAYHVRVLTDLSTMYTIAVPLVSRDSAGVAREISGELGAEVWSFQCATYRSRKKFYIQIKVAN